MCNTSEHWCEESLMSIQALGTSWYPTMWDTFFLITLSTIIIVILFNRYKHSYLFRLHQLSSSIWFFNEMTETEDFFFFLAPHMLRRQECHILKTLLKKYAHFCQNAQCAFCCCEQHPGWRNTAAPLTTVKMLGEKEQQIKVRQQSQWSSSLLSNFPAFQW